MKTPEFRVGDKVMFELAPDGKSRWFWDDSGWKDEGSSGLWEQGIIRGIDYQKNLMYLDVKCHNTGVYNIPLLGHRTYNPKQWDWSGFVRKVRMPVENIIETNEFNSLDRFSGLEL